MNDKTKKNLTVAVTYRIDSRTTPSQFVEFLNYIKKITNSDERENVLLSTMTSYVDVIREDINAIETENENEDEEK